MLEQYQALQKIEEELADYPHRTYVQIAPIHGNTLEVAMIGNDWVRVYTISTSQAYVSGCEAGLTGWSGIEE